ncbi:MAG: phosphatidylglycerophosphatase A [Neisseria sp.]|nr:phosphatidylglycerophosphatase A [Neisseria sp.]
MKPAENYCDFTPSYAWLRKNPVCWFAFGGGTGLSPYAPGTVGTLPALPLAALWLLCGLPAWSLALLAAALFPVGVWLCEVTEQRLCRPDYGGIVFDEIVAMLLVLSAVPFTWPWWLAAFVLFRLFDALKPFPIHQLDKKIHGGFGIMLDDIVAALMCVVLLLAAQWLLPWMLH